MIMTDNTNLFTLSESAINVIKKVRTGTENTFFETKGYGGFRHNQPLQPNIQAKQNNNSAAFNKHKR